MFWQNAARTATAANYGNSITRAKITINVFDANCCYMIDTVHNLLTKTVPPRMYSSVRSSPCCSESSCLSPDLTELDRGYIAVCRCCGFGMFIPRQGIFLSVLAEKNTWEI